MPSLRLYSEVNRLKAYVVRLKRSLELRDERIEQLTTEGLGLQESLTVVGEQRDEARAEVVALSSVAQELDEVRAELVEVQERPCD